MKKHLFPAILVMSVSLLFISFAKADSASTLKHTVKDSATVDSAAINTATLSEKLYQDMDLQDAGLSKEAVAYAVNGYEKLVDSGLVDNERYISIVDFSQSSRKKRFYVLDMQNEELVVNTFVSHGKNSGADMATSFSNTPNSEKSSLGFYITESTYSGKHGISLRLSGLERGFNDNAERRGIVVHGASYVTPALVTGNRMGRSQGCPALPESQYAKVINMIKDGSVMFVYNPSPKYLQSSALLN